MSQEEANRSTSQIKSWLKGFPLIVKLKKRVWPFFDGSGGLSLLNVAQTFSAYTPLFSGAYREKARLTVDAINQVFPVLNSLVRHLGNKEFEVENIENLSADSKNKASSEKLKELLDHYGSDKANHHNYHHIYGAILQNQREIGKIFEIGLGTNNTDVVSNMGSNGKPGASLRAFRDFCPNASVYGADVDRRVLFEEERIKTFFVDQTKPETFDAILTEVSNDFDLVIDDGLHSPNANISSLEFGLKIIKVGGWVVVEDIGVDATSVWQLVSALLPESYESHIFFADGYIVYAVNRIK